MDIMIDNVTYTIVKETGNIMSCRKTRKQPPQPIQNEPLRLRVHIQLMHRVDHRDRHKTPSTMRHAQLVRQRLIPTRPYVLTRLDAVRTCRHDARQNKLERIRRRTMVDRGEVDVEGDVGWEDGACGGGEEGVQEGGGEFGVDEGGAGVDVCWVREERRECDLGIVGAGEGCGGDTFFGGFTCSASVVVKR